MKKRAGLLLVLLGCATLAWTESIETLEIPKRPVTTAEPHSWLKKHTQHLEISRSQPIDLLFIGDSITERWLESAVKPFWDETFSAYRPANFGISGDRTEHVLWRIEQGILDKPRPKLVILLIGTNGLSDQPGDTQNIDDRVAGISACAKEILTRLPETHLLLLGIFPRGAAADHPYRAKIATINARLADLQRYDRLTYLDIGSVFLEPDGTLSKAVMPDALHLSLEGYRRWAVAIEPVIRQYVSPTL
jgi:lysophospholipase L1-like esterase